MKLLLVPTFNVHRVCLAAHAADIRLNAFDPVHANSAEPIVCRVVQFRLIVVVTVALSTLYRLVTPLTMIARSLQMVIAGVVALVLTELTIVVSMLMTLLSGLIGRVERTTPSCVKSSSGPLALLS